MARSPPAPMGHARIEQVGGGQLSIDWDGVPWVEIDVDRRCLEVDLTPVKALTKELPRILLSGGFRGMRRGLRIPQRLSELGWTVTLKVGKRPLARLGRGASALTGNIRVELSALPALLRLV
ncbi:MAG: hypothetical protein HKL79_01120 [Thermoplasmata archaeon]|nr:hypothetical protein [Thermoplasmata archaeon]